MVRRLIVLFISILGFLFPKIVLGECDLKQDQIDDLERSVACESVENLNNCKEILGLDTEKKLAERAGARVGYKVADKVFQAHLSSPAAGPNGMLLDRSYQAVLKVMEDDVARGIAEYKAELPSVFSDAARHEKIVMDARIAALKKAAFNDAGVGSDFKKYSEAFQRDFYNDTARTHWAEELRDRVFDKINKNPNILRDGAGFRAAENLPQEMLEKFQPFIERGKKIEINDMRDVMNAGWKNAEIDAVNEYIETKANPEKSAKYRRLQELKKELAKFRDPSKPLAASVQRAQELLNLRTKYSSVFSAAAHTNVSGLMSVMGSAKSAEANVVRSGVGGARFLAGVGAKQGTKRVVGLLVGGPIGGAILVAQVGSEINSAAKRAACAKDSKYLDCDDGGNVIADVTDNTKEFLSMKSWREKDLELDANPMFCAKMKEAYKIHVEPPGFEIKCNDTGFEIKRPVGYASSVTIRAKTEPNGDLQESIWKTNIEGSDYLPTAKILNFELEKDYLPKGGFYMIYKDGQPEEIRYRKWDLATSMSYKTGYMDEKDKIRISDYKDSRYYSGYPIGQRIRDGGGISSSDNTKTNDGAYIGYVTGTMMTNQSHQRLLVEAGSCCSSSRNVIGDARCKKLGATPSTRGTSRGSAEKTR